MPFFLFLKGGWIGKGRMLTTPLLDDLAWVTSQDFEINVSVSGWVHCFKKTKMLKFRDLFICLRLWVLTKVTSTEEKENENENQGERNKYKSKMKERFILEYIWIVCIAVA